MKIPKSLHTFFWDVDVAKLDPKKKPYFVINRLLDKGDIEAVRWVKKTYSRQQIADAFLKLRDFNAKVGAFWGLYLHIPRQNILCLRVPYREMRKTHWPY